MAEEAIEAATEDGRTLSLRVMDPADMLDLLEAAGENSGNRAWLRFAMTVCSVRAVDGVPVPFPRDPGAIKALARRLGAAGVEAARGALFGEDDGGNADAAAGGAAEAEAAKN